MKSQTRDNNSIIQTGRFASYWAAVSARIRQAGKLAPIPLLDLIALVAVVVIASIFTGLNMFNFPHYENDEGVYMGSAWAMYQQGQLSYYTYTYDHPPFGWFQIGAWASLIGGFLTFGMTVDTGRVLMLIVAVLSTLLIFLIVRRATGHTTASLFAAVIFAVSPLGVSLHRQVWLDNIATLWLLVSLYTLISSKGRLGYIVLSALTFGLAFWTKEIFVVFLPGFLYLAFTQSHPMHRRFAFALWGAAAISAISLFVLLAFVKDELLPPGVLWSSPEPHVSMIDTYMAQAARGGSDGLLNFEGEFWEFFGQWGYNDPVLMLGGLAASGIGLLLGRRNQVLFGVSISVLLFFLFLSRGGVVLYYYVIPLLALLAVALGLLAGHITSTLSRWRLLGLILPMAIFALTLVLTQSGAQTNNEKVFTLDSTTSQRQAARWVADNLPSDSMIIMDAYPWADLRDPSFTGGRTFPNAHYYFPAVSDPEIRDGLLQNDWRNIDYLVISPSTEADIDRGYLPLIAEAFANSDEVQDFSSGDWRVRVLQVRKEGASNNESSERL